MKKILTLLTTISLLIICTPASAWHLEYSGYDENWSTEYVLESNLLSFISDVDVQNRMRWDYVSHKIDPETGEVHVEYDSSLSGNYF